MGTRSYAQVAPTAGQVALNAYIYGYGGHSLVTPHAALKQLWWTDDRIDAKVTRTFVISKLRGEEREFLDRPLAFGEGLTDDTYMEWILERARRLFLILAEVGVPDQIFGCIDDSWDDDDLPIPLETVADLELTYENDESINKKFYNMQFVYLLRELKRGAHIDYGPKEHIPMEYVNTLPPAVSLQHWDRVHLPGRSEKVFVRRKLALVDKETGEDSHDTFLRDVRRAQTLRHEHIAPAWASYTSEHSGYIVSDFVPEHNLRTFIDHRTPTQLMRVPESDRSRLLLEWMHCLADALTFLHQRGSAHTTIRPSNILIDRENRICFADVGSLRTFQLGKKTNKQEVYDYAAPESQICREPMTVWASATSPPLSSLGAFSKLRKMSSSGTDTSSSSGGSSSSGRSSLRSNSICSGNNAPLTPPLSTTGRSNSITSIATTISPRSFSKSSAANSMRNFSRHLAISSPTPPLSPPSSPPSIARSTAPSSPTSTVRPSIQSVRGVLPRPSLLNPDSLRDLPTAKPEMSDIFSLACVYLDILTFMLKGRCTDFVKHRASRTISYSVSSVSGSSARNRTAVDTSFHADPDKINAWLAILREEAEKQVREAKWGEEQLILRAVPELLRLVKSMMAQNATLRPTALHVRDRIQANLVGEGGVESLCCAGRRWESDSPEDTREEYTIGMPALQRTDTRDSAMSAAQSSYTSSTRRAATQRCQSGARRRWMSFGPSSSSESDDGDAAEPPTVPRQRNRRTSEASVLTATLVDKRKGGFWRRPFARTRTG